MGAFGLTFMVVAAAAPLTAMASNISLSLAFGVGAGTVGLLVVVAVLLTVFATAYVALSRHVTNAGAYYAFIGFGLGRAVGAGAAFVATVAYNMAAGGMIAATGYFADVTAVSYLDVDLPWYLYGAVALALTAYLGRRGVDVAQRLTTGVSLLQFAVIVVLGVAVLLERPGSWDLGVFTPGQMLDGNIAMTLVFCILSFVGFEATAIYGEEAKAARRSIRVATYTSIALLVAVFVFSTWSIVAAYDDVQAAAAADPGSLVFRAADAYLGSWSGGLLSAMVTISFLAAGVAFHNMAARYHFSLGRTGLLPRALAATHPRFGTPHRSSALQIGLSVLMLVPFAVSGADPILNLFPAVSGITSISLTSLMIGCCLSIVVAGRRGLLPESRWVTLGAPLVAGAGMVAIVAIILANYQEVTGSSSRVIALMPLLPLAAGLYGAVAYTLRARRVGELEIDAS
ncbi:APC family permease [Nocardioides sp. ChNu-153]|nr:APC family permease [Nocardioides sp. ChNu-153]